MDWRWVEGFVGAYQVNARGDVRSVDRSVDVFRRGRKFTRKFKGQIIVPVLSRRGYLWVGLRICSKQKCVLVHRIVAKAFIPNPENSPQVDHKDSDKTNNYATNLQWVTDQDNKDLMVARGRSTKGIRNGNAKLTPQTVLHLRSLALAGMTFTFIAKKFGISRKSVRNVVIRMTWGHV